MKTFSEYRKEKSKQWYGFTSKSSKSKAQSKVQEVLISIGLMDWREKEAKLMYKRGKKVSLRISKTATKSEIQIIAENKWKQFHPDLYNEDEFYTLVYESGEEVETLPGSDEKFTLNSYQAAVDKDFKRITFYLCKNSDVTISKINYDLDTYTCDNGSDNDRDSEPDQKRLKVWDKYYYEPPYCADIGKEDFETNALVSNVKENNDKGEEKKDKSTEKKSLVTPLTLDEVMQLMHSEVDQENQFFFVIRRNAPLQRILSVWQREAKKGGLKKKLMVHFAGEVGIDEGALSKVFLTSAIHEIGINIFPNGAPVDSMLHVQNGDFVSCGQLVAYSLTHGGPPPCFLHPNVYSMLLNSDFDKEKLSTENHLTETERELLISVKADPKNHTDLIIEHGYTGLIHQGNSDCIVGTVLVSIVNRRMCYLQEFLKGLELFNMFKYVKQFSTLFKPLFVKTPDTKVIDGNYIVSLLRPEYAEEHSTKRQLEEMVIDLLQDLLAEVETGDLVVPETAIVWKDNRATVDDSGVSKMEADVQYENVIVSAKGILAWITGQEHKPVDGGEFFIKIKFDHECFVRYPDHKVCFPMVRSCSREITLPIAHMKSPDQFRKIFLTAYSNGQSFSRE